jgi:hypothetical protein
VGADRRSGDFLVVGVVDAEVGEQVVDLLTDQVRATVGLPTRFEPSGAGVAGVRSWSRTDRVLRGIDGADRAAEVPGVTQVRVTARAGAQVRPANSAYDRFGYVIAWAGSAEEVHSALGKAVDMIEVRLGSA